MEVEGGIHLLAEPGGGREGEEAGGAEGLALPVDEAVLVVLDGRPLAPAAVVGLHRGGRAGGRRHWREIELRFTFQMG